mgnify:CR=1 FL=1
MRRTVTRSRDQFERRRMKFSCNFYYTTANNLGFSLLSVWFSICLFTLIYLPFDLPSALSSLFSFYTQLELELRRSWAFRYFCTRLFLDLLIIEILVSRVSVEIASIVISCPRSDTSLVVRNIIASLYLHPSKLVLPSFERRNLYLVYSVSWKWRWQNKCGVFLNDRAYLAILKKQSRTKA